MSDERPYRAPGDQAEEALLEPRSWWSKQRESTKRIIYAMVMVVLAWAGWNLIAILPAHTLLFGNCVAATLLLSGVAASKLVYVLIDRSQG